MKILKFLWIDDDDSRKSWESIFKSYKYKTGRNSIKADIKFLIVNKVDALKAVSDFKNISTYDLILIDHLLTNTTGAIKKGTTIAELIREKLPNCPILGVTAGENKELLNQNVLSIYDDLFFIGEIDDSLSSIFTIAYNFKILNRLKIDNDLTRTVNLFKPPKDDFQLLLKILPSASLNSNIQRSNVRMISRWTLHKLIANPGLLYNRKWAANLAGIKESSFNKIEKLLVNAKYKGIFCDDNNPRWWKSKTKEIIFQLSKNKDANLPWVAGHYLPRISKKDYCVCHSCGELFPETMGYLDTTEKSSLVPLHFRHAQPHPSYSSDLYFDEIVVMKDTL